MKTINDDHQLFASFFKNDSIAPYAYLLSKRLQEGKICIHKKDVDLYSTEIPYPPPFSDVSSKKLISLVGASGKNSPFILHKDRLYLHRYFTYETQILAAIANLLNAEKSEIKERVKSLQKNILQATEMNRPVNTFLPMPKYSMLYKPLKYYNSLNRKTVG